MSAQEQQGWTVWPEGEVPSKACMEVIDCAFGIIANASEGDWSRETTEWQDAAARWRDTMFHPALRAYCDAHPEAIVEEEVVEDDDTVG